ncbi:MAG TPA: glutathione S-transferase family protein [Candidatus Binataceae bacterium]|nr:glutathione S-transferase family protein [Candidatus Binataceae bacterium]
MADKHRAYRMYGMSQSYFTRKLTSYLDYKGIPYLLRRFGGANPAARAAGWPGGVPVVMTPDGAFMWDTTAMIHHLELRFPQPSVLPEDPVQRFLCYAIEDVIDEWFYRTAVGSRWFYAENANVGGRELARDMTHELPIAGDRAFEGIKAHVTASCEPLGVTAENIAAWIDDVLKPWLRVTGAHLATQPYFFGARPSLADFAFFGGNAAHFINDPLCRRWVDAESPSVVTHTQGLIEPEDRSFGDWSGDVSDTLIAILADMGRLYLPWVSKATVAGDAEIVFESGQRVRVNSTPFLREARRALLARYIEHRCAALDEALDRAGILGYYADYVDQAGTLPDYQNPPQPALNRPFGPPGQNQS